MNRRCSARGIKAIRLFAGLIITAVCMLPAIAGAQSFHEQNLNRVGADFERIALTTGGPSVCAQACANNAQCRAWTYAKPGVEGPKAICRLKSAVAHGRADPCCVSGVADGASAGMVAGYPIKKSTATAALATPKQISAPVGLTAALRPKPTPPAKPSAQPDAKPQTMSAPIASPAPIPEEAMKASAAPMQLMPGNWIETHN